MKVLILNKAQRSVSEKGVEKAFLAVGSHPRREKLKQEKPHWKNEA